MGIPGYQWQIVQTRLKVDAQLDSPALMCATLTIRLSLTASAPHSNPVHAGRNPKAYRLVWIQTASSIEACAGHV